MKYALPALMTVFFLSATMAHAQPGRLTDDTYMRTGPGTNFPIIATLTSFEDVEITACTNQWVWCQIQTENLKQGWILGSYLNLPNYGPVLTNGAKVGIPLTEYTQNVTGTNYLPTAGTAPAQVVSPNAAYIATTPVTQPKTMAVINGAVPAQVNVPATANTPAAAVPSAPAKKNDGPAVSPLTQKSNDMKSQIRQGLTKGTQFEQEQQ